MAHDRKIVLSGVSLTKTRSNRNSAKAALEVMDEIESVLVASNFFNNVPFKWIGLSIMFGLKYEEKPHYKGISKKYGDISLTIEVDTHDLLGASFETVKRIFMEATLKSVIHLGKKYQLNTKELEGIYEQIR